MKTFNGKKMNFGFAAVNAGQRNVNVDPELIATSTEGSFRLTAPVTRALGVQHGENVMFISNIDSIETAIAQRNPELVAFCEEQGLEFGTPDANAAIHAEFDAWCIAKGIVERDTKGNNKKTSVRLTKDDRIRFVAAHYQEMIDAAMASEDENLKAALTRDDITEDEVKEILMPFVQADEIDKVKGSKVASPSGVTGVGTNLCFTDTNVWQQFKADLADEATSINRVYSINIDEMIQIPVFDGYEEVMVNALPIGEFNDQKPAVRANKKGADFE